MKLIKSDVQLVSQEPGIVGMLKLIELAGRIAYKSEDRITESSYIKFVDMLYNKGHHAVFNLGTVYLKVPASKKKKVSKILKNKYSKKCKVDKFYYITTDYRVICRYNLIELMEKYWIEPTIYHYRRVTTKWICSRVIAQEVLRHRLLCPVMESTRYINYSKGKFEGITYILPQWIYKRKELALLDPNNSHLLELDGEELWNALVQIDPIVSRRNKFLKTAEEEYLFEVLKGEDGGNLKPEDARGVLPLDTKAELYITGYVKDWMYKGPEDSLEKAGFFQLRCALDAHSDIRVLANKLKADFETYEIDKLK